MMTSACRLPFAARRVQFSVKVALGAALLGTAAAAFAQNAPTAEPGLEVAEVTVTGSRIQRAEGVEAPTAGTCWARRRCRRAATRVSPPRSTAFLRFVRRPRRPRASSAPA